MNKVYPVNVFLIEDNGLTLIDTGFPGSADKIFAAIGKGGKKPEDIKRIILTHAHPDQSGSAAEIGKRLKVPVWAHRIDAEILEKGIGGREPKILGPGILSFFLYHIFIKNSSGVVDPIKFERKLEDRDSIDIAGGIQAIHVPGHSLGQISLLVKNESVLIAADLCANFIGLDMSTVSEDHEVSIESIGKVSRFPFDKAVFGHGNPIMRNADKTMKAFYRKLQLV
ncbi:MBL fold metallo-hydrolase [Dyadobacter sp. 32]|uniref:MBL fold metallo-hydrolase n=1 Tax=Dyadobacter sp. 32 TaxID=538966 RepID=UPI0039C6285D